MPRPNCSPRSATPSAPGSNPLTALATLAELRVLQGRQEEAAQLLSGIEDRPGALRAVIGLDLAKGDLDVAAEKVEHRLESAQGGHAELATLNLILARIELRRGDPGRRAPPSGEGVSTPSSHRAPTCPRSATPLRPKRS